MEPKGKSYGLPPLSQLLIDEIIFAMEDQANTYLLDLKEGMVVPEWDCELSDSDSDEDRFLDIPQWTPADGFRIMDMFAQTIRNPVYRSRLQRTLQSGRGVFRRFKDILSEQPILERQWFGFKNRQLTQVIRQWYRTNDGAIHLEALETAPEEPTDDILQEDFTIDYTMQAGREEIGPLVDDLLSELESSQPDGKTIASRIRYRLEEEPPCSYICARTRGGNLAGLIAYRLTTSDTIEVVCFGNKAEYRGIGLFRHLFDAFSRMTARKGYTRIHITLAGDSLGLEKLFAEVHCTTIVKELSLRACDWNDEMLSSEQAYL